MITPTRPRWQPLRTGLVNLFHYDDETFDFRDGHLLLRGNNGTGKSKVLALTLPFLLDARLAPARVEPDGDPGKRMEWNLLLGGKYSERQGYAWLEFGRLDQAGEPCLITLGCGLKAVAGRALQCWFFITGARVGRDLRLIDEHERTLTRERLAELLADNGAVYDSPEQYRRAVDEALFQLGSERYEALVNLLIQLRQPQLSKRPDERALSRALSESLPPLAEPLLAQVAEAFRNLDAEHGQLHALGQVQAALTGFLDHYRPYARVAARRRAHRLLQARERHAQTGAALDQARDALERAYDEDNGLGRDAAAHKATLAHARSEAEALRVGAATGDVGDLRRAEEEAAAQAARAARAQADERRLQAELARAGERLRECQLRHGDSASRVEAARAALAEAAARADLAEAAARADLAEAAARADLAEAAARADLADHHARLLAALDQEGDPPAIAAAEAEAAELAQRRREAIDHLRALDGAVARAAAAHQEARAAWQWQADELRRSEEDHAEAARAAEAAGAALVADFGRYARALGELRLGDAEAVVANLGDWCASLAGPNPATAALEAAWRPALAAIEGQRAGLLARRRDLDEAVSGLEAERARLAAGVEARPPRPHTRDAALPVGRPGAPLWRLVEFRPDLPAAQAAGLEAALEASGLLDAWVLPAGCRAELDIRDTLLLPAAPAPLGLGAVLQPAVDRGDPAAAAVDDSALHALLDAVGWGESDHPAWVDADGRWCLGPARGAWSKPRAEYIGSSAREQARQRRLADLAGPIAAQQVRLAALDAELAALDARARAADTERAGLPDDTPLRLAQQRSADLAAQVRARRERAARAGQALADCRAALEAQTRARAEAAADLGLAPAGADLEPLAEALRDWTVAAGAWWPLLREHRHQREALREAAQAVAQIGERLEEQHQRRAAADAAAARAAVQRDTLRAGVGEAARQVLERLRAVEARIADTERALEAVRCGQRAMAGRIEGLKSAIAHGEEELRAHGAECAAALQDLEGFAARGLLRVAVAELEPPGPGPWDMEPAVHLARLVEAQLTEVDAADPAWERRRRGLMEHISALQNTLARRGQRAVAEPDGELLVVRVAFQGRSRVPDQLAADLTREIAERRRLLSAREQDLLENHLISALAGHLRAMIAAAEQAVARMNDELEQRPTSTGMRLRLRWRLLEPGEAVGGRGAPAGLAEVRGCLCRPAAEWSADDRAAVGAFLRRRIDEARALDPSGTPVEVLGRALDYRHWHRFLVERRQDGRWRPAYGPASGGERALVVTIPLFAAASSHYGSASPHAPRLVLLDEAFAGIDDDARAKCMGLLAQFDLDFMMTSEREWGCYPDLPGLAIAQLVRREEFDAVFVSRWYWDGRRRVRGEGGVDGVA